MGAKIKFIKLHCSEQKGRTGLDVIRILIKIDDGSWREIWRQSICAEETQHLTPIEEYELHDAISVRLEELCIDSGNTELGEKTVYAHHAPQTEEILEFRPIPLFGGKWSYDLYYSTTPV